MPPEQSSGEKTEEPTARKKRKAREEGEVVYSNEVNNFVVLLTAVLIFWAMADYFMKNLVTEITNRLGNLGKFDMNMQGAVSLGRSAMVRVAQCSLPLGICVAAVALLTGLIQTQFLLCPKQISPDLKKIDPIQGTKRLFSAEALSRLFVALGKITVIGLVMWIVIGSRLIWIRALIGREPRGILMIGGRLSFLLLMYVAGGMLLVATAEYAWSRYRYHKKLMMTKTELQEEQKRDEGKPEIVAQQQRRRQEIARGRMMEAIPEADVVVTNPTCIAVAIKWDEDEMNAPTVVAKGRRNIAKKIREIAREHGVPIIERKPLAQVLEKTVDVGMEVPPDLYYAVAQVLSFVMHGGQNSDDHNANHMNF
jgi:flagellar biosynthetic protein FlhB